MKAIILAAGYATRLFPLTQDFPKPLLPINKKPMIEYIISKISELGIHDIVVVTNAKFTPHFLSWKKKYRGKEKITVVNDHTSSNEDRLGAIGDIQYVLEQEHIDDDLLIVGGDNIFKFSLLDAYELFQEKNENVIVAYDVKDLELAKKFGTVSITQERKVTSFVEKSPTPASTLAAICTYFYPRKTLALLKKYLKEGNNPDAPGFFAAWLVEHATVYAQTYSEAWYDVGSFESLKEAKEDFGEKDVDMKRLMRGERI